MDTQFAATLLAVIEHGSIAAAARRLGITPGAVTLRVKALERELGTALLGRAGRAVGPTAAAVRLAAPLRDILARTAELRQLAGADGEVAGELRLGTIATAGTGILPGLLAALTRAHPGLDLMIEPGTSVELCDRVLDGALDAAIVVAPPGPGRKGEVFAPWIEETLVLVAPPALAAEPPLALLERQPFIRYDRRHRGGRIVDAWLKDRGLAVRDRIELDALDGIVAMVAAGLGVAIIPDWAGPRPAGLAVATLPLPPPAPVRCIGLYHRLMAPRQTLIDTLAPALRALRAAGALQGVVWHPALLGR